jgi:hypothetical protein
MQYRLATRADVPRLRELMNAQYARKKTDAYFHWQYFDSAWPTRVMCTVVDGRVMGMFGMQQRHLVDGTRVGQAIDLLLDPSLRGSGAFAQMGERILAEWPDLQAVCVLPNLNGRNAVVRALQWPVLGKVDALDWQTDQPLAPTMDEVPLPPMPAQLAWNDRELQWRFAAHPDYRYTWHGPVLTKLFEDPLTGQRFGDLVLLQGAPTAIRTAALALAAQGVGRVTTWALPHTPLWQALRALGFTPLAQERYFCLRVLDPAVTHLADWRKWSLQPADAEFF